MTNKFLDKTRDNLLKSCEVFPGGNYSYDQGYIEGARTIREKFNQVGFQGYNKSFTDGFSEAINQYLDFINQYMDGRSQDV